MRRTARSYFNQSARSSAQLLLNWHGGDNEAEWEQRSSSQWIQRNIQLPRLRAINTETSSRLRQRGWSTSLEPFSPRPIVLIRVVSNMLMFLASRCSLKSQRSRYSPNLTTTLFFQQAGRKLLLIIKSYFDFLFDMYILHSDSTTRIQIE